jgi:hypothetical protein
MEKWRPITPSEAFIKAVEAETGESVESLRSAPVDERRQQIEKRFGSPMKIVSHWPFIGRSQPSQMITRGEVDKLVDQAIKR